VSKPTADQLRELTTRYRDAVETFDVHRDAWQEAITDAVDGGMKAKDVGAIVGVSEQRVRAIIARVYAQNSSQ
jgi:predicted transcriptional regulator